MLVDKFEYALKSNDAWANYKGHQNPAFFPNLAKGQSPSIRMFLLTPPSSSHTLLFSITTVAPLLQKPALTISQQFGLDAAIPECPKPPSSVSNPVTSSPTAT